MSNGGSDDLFAGETFVDLAPGLIVFGRYELKSILGRGGMGVVWRVWDQRLEVEVALKFLPDAVAQDNEALFELRRETRLSMALTHPHIVRVHDLAESPGRTAIAMEVVDGGSLVGRKFQATERALDEATLTPWVEQICLALDYAHTKAKIVHRDLKPANILLTGEGEVKIADFGIARSLAETRTRLTSATGMTSGTLLYMSPQQLLGKRPTASDDIYALGVLLYELLTSKPPFFRGDLSTQIQYETPDTIAERRAELGITSLAPVSVAWETTIRACLAKDPAERPGTAGEVWRRLQAVASVEEMSLAEMMAAPTIRGAVPLESPPPPAAATKAAEPVEPSLPRKRGALGMIVILGVIAAVALGWWRISSTPPLPQTQIVRVSPPSAGVRIQVDDGRDEVVPTSGEISLSELSEGSHRLRVTAPGYEAYETSFRHDPARPADAVTVVLERSRGQLRIEARAGSSVFAIDGAGTTTDLGIVSTGKQVLLSNVLPLGKYRVRIEHPDCAPWENANVELSADGVTTVVAQQTALPGTLRVSTVPAGAVIRLDGKALPGRSPMDLTTVVSEVSHTLEAELAGFRVSRATLNLRPREARAIELPALIPLQGTIRLESERVLPEQGIQVLLEGEPAKLADGIINEVKPGVNSVEIRHPGFKTWKSSVLVRDGMESKLAVDLEPLPAAVGTYLVKSGDTGVKIAQNHGTSWSELMKANPDVNWMRLMVGQELHLPASESPEQTAVDPLAPISAPSSASKADFWQGGSQETKETSSPPRAIKQTPPSYPAAMLRAGITGEVIVSFVVDSLGNVGQAQIVKSSNVGFDNAVLSAVAQWRYQPGTKDGKPVDTRLSVKIPFRLAD